MSPREGIKFALFNTAFWMGAIWYTCQVAHLYSDKPENRVKYLFSPESIVRIVCGF